MDELCEIRQSITRHARDGLSVTVLPGLSVLSTTERTPPLGEVLEPAFGLVAGGAKYTALNGEVYRYGAGEFIVASVDLPVISSVVNADLRDPFMAVVLRLNPDRIASLLLDTGAVSSPTGEHHPPRAIGVGHAGPALLNAIARLLALLDHPSDIPALGAGIEREILWRLLTGPQAENIRQIGTADSRLVHLARAIRWIREHYEQPFRIKEVAAIAAMSPTSFHRHFRALTSMTPLEYQKQLRLNDAHVQLLSGDQSIATVGYSVGYGSPSQFSREYRRTFGATPSQTAIGTQSPTQ